MPINAQQADSPKTLSIDLGIVEDVQLGRELGPGLSKEWARCSVSKYGGMGPFRTCVISSVQADSHDPYNIYIYIYIYLKKKKKKNKNKISTTMGFDLSVRDILIQ